MSAPRQPGGGPDHPWRRPILAAYALAWAVVTAPLTYAALILGARECSLRAGYAAAPAAAAALVLLLGGWAVLASARWPPMLLAWLALAFPPAVSLLVGFGCNALWW